MIERKDKTNSDIDLIRYLQSLAVPVLLPLSLSLSLSLSFSLSVSLSATYFSAVRRHRHVCSYQTYFIIQFHILNTRKASEVVFSRILLFVHFCIQFREVHLHIQKFRDTQSTPQCSQIHKNASFCLRQNDFKSTLPHHKTTSNDTIQNIKTAPNDTKEITLSDGTK